MEINETKPGANTKHKLELLQESNRPIVIFCTLGPIVRPGYGYIPYASFILAETVRRDISLNVNMDIVSLALDDLAASGIQTLVKELTGVKRRVLVAFSTYLWNAHPLEQALPSLLSLPHVDVVLGGPMWHEDDVTERMLLRYPQLLGIHRGDGEAAVTELVVSWQSRQFKPSAIPGLSYAGQNGVTVLKPPVWLKHPPKPWISYEKGSTLCLESGRTYEAVIESKRGCPQKCRYCTWGRRNFILTRQREDVCEDITSIGRNPKISMAGFCDANFFADKERTLLFLETMVEKAHQVAWYLEIQPHYYREEYGPFLRRLSSCTLSYGLQTAQAKTLKAVGRNFSASSFRQELATIRRESPGTLINLGVIYGLPGEMMEDYFNTLELALSFEPNSLTMSRLSILPGSSFYADAERLRMRHSGWPLFRLLSTPELSENEIDYLGAVSSFIRQIFQREAVAKVLFRIGSEEGNQFTPIQRMFEAYRQEFQQTSVEQWPEPICSGLEDNQARLNQSTLFADHSVTRFICRWLESYSYIKEVECFLLESQELFSAIDGLSQPAFRGHLDLDTRLEKHLPWPPSYF